MSDYNDPYATGYRKPPLASRFKKGQSGNPRGRPKGRRDASTIAADTIYKMVTVQEAGRAVKKTTLEVLLLRLIQAAMKDPIRGLPPLLAALKVIAPDAFAEGQLDSTGRPKAGLLAMTGILPVDDWIDKANSAVRPPDE